MISQLISTLDEVVPFTANYFENIALRNNALVTTTFVQFNTAIGQINTEIAGMNGYVTATATNAANALASANNAATSAATATAKALLAQSVVIPTNATYGLDALNWRDTMMSKAEFNAVAAERRANRAGSGADSFGKGNATTTLNVNDGIHTSTTVPNTLYLGKVSGTGTSLTDSYVASINGSVILAKYLNATTADATLLLPPAPTVLPSTATLTQQQIDSGVIKHSDTSDSGLILNGKIDTTANWTPVGGTLSVSAGKLLITNGTSTEGQAYQAFTTVVGKKYVLEIYNEDGTSLTNGIRVGTAINGSTLVNLSNVASATRSEVEFTATALTTYITMATGSTVTGETALFDNIAIFPLDAKSRSDLVFLESWHEDINDSGRDFVYPLGNVQYLGTSTVLDGVTVNTVAGAFAGAVTYSLFSDTWQADSALVGKGYVWSTLTDLQKKAFVANPENNCYLDGDKVIQVRYRMRVIMGWGDSWYNSFSSINVLQTSLNGYLSYLNSGSSFIQSKGKQASTNDYGTNALGIRGFNSSEQMQYGEFKSNSVNDSYDGATRTIGVCLVHRRNQGMMHPVYNPNGTKLASDSLPWYSTTVSFTSIADCFTDSKLLTASGYIGTTTGRADGIFYDQVHEGDITDLRVNSRGMNDYQRTSDKWFAKLQDSTYRGTEGEWVTERAYQATSATGTNAVFLVNANVKLNIGDTVFIYVESSSSIRRVVVRAVYTDTFQFEYPPNTNLIDRVGGTYIIVSVRSTRTKSNTLTHTDIIGSPANYSTAWKQSGVSGVPLIVAEDGTSLLPTGTTGSDGLATFKLSRKANATPLQVLKSTDSGVTWTALTVTTHYTFSTTTNAITFTAGNIPLVAHLIMVTYQTHTNMAVAAVNSEVLAIGDAWMGNFYDKDLGASLTNSLLQKVATNPYSSKPMLVNLPLQEYTLSANKFSPLSWAAQPKNGFFNLYENTSPAVKVFPYLTRSNGKAYLNLVFKEMKYGSYAAPTVVTAASATYTINMTYKINIAGCALDGKVIQWTAVTATVAVDWSLYDVSPTGVIYLLSSGAVYANARLYDGDSWGDDSKFNIVDNVSTTTDTNGATVLIGQKRVELPYFIGAAE